MSTPFLQNVEDNSGAEDVRFGVVAKFVQDFWGNIAGAAAFHGELLAGFEMA